MQAAGRPTKSALIALKGSFIAQLFGEPRKEKQENASGSEEGQIEPRLSAPKGRTNTPLIITFVCSVFATRKLAKQAERPALYGHALSVCVCAALRSSEFDKGAGHRQFRERLFMCL